MGRGRRESRDSLHEVRVFGSEELPLGACEGWGSVRGAVVVRRDFQFIGRTEGGRLGVG